MPFYENVFIARQDITAQHAEALAEQFSAVIVEKGGKVEKQEQWGLRNLSYRIKKNRKGYYVRLNIDGPAEAIQEMERQMRLNEDIIRHMTVRVEALD
ncbi:MAG: 30S ribosomal protein S6, partial [Acetobacterales bacterium]